MKGTKNTGTRRLATVLLACVSVMSIPCGSFAQQAAANSSTAPVQSQVSQKSVLQQLATSQSLTELASSQLTDPTPSSPTSSGLNSPADQNQLNAVQQAPKTKKGVSKKFIALGVLGAAAAVGGAVAMSEAKHNSNCVKYSATQTAQQICGDVHTAGEIMLPVGAGVAALGFFFGLRHAF